MVFLSWPKTGGGNGGGGGINIFQDFRSSGHAIHCEKIREPRDKK
jgi:hypothetical protein